MDVRLQALRLRNRRLLDQQKNVPLSSILQGRTFYGGTDHHKTFRGDGASGGALFGGAKTYKELGKHIAELEGSGFFGDFWDGFRGSIASLGDVVTNVVKKIPGPIGKVGGLVGDAVTGTMKALPEYKKKYEETPEMKKIHDIGMKVGDVGASFAKGPAVALQEAHSSGLLKDLAGKGKKQGEKDREDEKLAMEIKGVKDKAKKGKGKKKMSDKMRRRSALVKKIMKEKGLKMIDASKHIKKHNLKY